MNESMSDWNQEWKACAKEASDEADERAMKVWQELNDAQARRGADRDTPLPVQFARALLAASTASDKQTTFQARVQPWLMECFGAMIAGDREERNHRFFEEAGELVQACGMSASEAHQLVDYVWNRPVGDKHQEVGGVMVTLAALCLANELDMHAAAETELARIWTKVEAIRAKQAAKPKHSPLPIAAPPAASAESGKEEAKHPDDQAVERFAQAMKEKMAAAREKGRHGWQFSNPAYLSKLLREHVEKGDPRDVANFCMMLWHQQSAIAPPAKSAESGKGVEPALTDADWNELYDFAQRHSFAIWLEFAKTIAPPPAHEFREAGVWEPDGSKFRTYARENLNGKAMFVKEPK